MFRFVCMAAGVATAATVWGAPPALDVEWLGESAVGELALRELRYTGSHWRGEPQRVFARYATPPGDGPFPAILQIHGGGQTAYQENVVWFAKHGYACLSFDWSGLRDGRSQDVVTLWPEELAGEYLGSGDGQETDVLLYHVLEAASRGIDVLASRPEVDADRIGVQGISWGGLAAWVLNGKDDRVKAVVPVYGTGGLVDHWNGEGMGLRRRPEAWQARWVAAFDPASFTETQHGPVMFLNGTNDFFGPLVDGERLLASFRVPHRRSYGANRMHSLDPANVAAGMAWLETHLKGGRAFPAEPILHAEAMASGGVRVVVAADGANDVFVHYRRGASLPLVGCWLTTRAAFLQGDQWEAAVPIVQSLDPIALIAESRHGEERFSLSSKVLDLLPARDLEAARPNESQTDVLSQWGAPDGGWYVFRGTDFLHARTPDLRLVGGELDGRQAIVLRGEKARFNIATRVLADAGRTEGNDRALEIWTHDVATLRVRTNWFLRMPGAECNEAELQPGEGWRRSIVPLQALHPFDEDADAPDGTSDAGLESWNDVHQINFIGEATEQGEPGFGLLRWTCEPQEENR